jgi:hypothetical protein
MSSTQIGQYLDNETLIKNIPDIKLTINDLGTTDTYHEEKILKKYLSYPKESQILIYKAAVQLAIIGFGNKNYGFIRIDDKNIITLKDLFDKLKIKYMEKINEKYLEDDLSARRLLRLFRFQIQKFITENNRPSYLWNKYADKNKENNKYISICFPGAEHIIETSDEGEFLLTTYARLDEQMNTKFRSRLKRIFIARKIFDPIRFQNVDY